MSEWTRIITPRGESAATHLLPWAAVASVYRHRALIAQLTRREIEGRYRGSFLGLFWSLIQPLLLLATYTFVFGMVFRARWPTARSETIGEFAVILFCGLLAFNVFAEVVSRAPGLVSGAPNYVRNVVFPLEVLPVTAVGSALFHALLGLGILLGARLLQAGSVPLTVLLLPVAAVPLVLLSLSAGWLLSSLGVFVPDLRYAVPLVVQLVFFLTPIVYPAASVPERLRGALRLNPLASIVDNFRRVTLEGRPPLVGELAMWTALTAALVLAAYAWFMKTRRAFPDAL